MKEDDATSQDDAYDGSKEPKFFVDLGIEA
jgi:hypothetical protein